jgi:single-strand DNA-binding protein
MAGSINKVILIGNLGADPEIRALPSGQMVANLSVATSEVYNDREGQRQERTEWHRVVAYAKTAELAERYLRKGSKVYVEGRIHYRSWDDQQTGQKKYATEIVVNQLTFLDSAASRGGGAGAPPEDGGYGGGQGGGYGAGQGGGGYGGGQGGGGYGGGQGGGGYGGQGGGGYGGGQGGGGQGAGGYGARPAQPARSQPAPAGGGYGAAPRPAAPSAPPAAPSAPPAEAPPGSDYFNDDIPF